MTDLGSYANREVSVELDFHCPCCTTISTAYAAGSGTASSLTGSSSVGGAAEESARRDAARALDLARCPKCKRRDPNAVSKFWQKTAMLGLLGGGVLGLLVVVLATDPFSAIPVAVIGLVAVVIYQWIWFSGVDAKIRFRE